MQITFLMEMLYLHQWSNGSIWRADKHKQAIPTDWMVCFTLLSIAWACKSDGFLNRGTVDSIRSQFNEVWRTYSCWRWRRNIPSLGRNRERFRCRWLCNRGERTPTRWRSTFDPIEWFAEWSKWPKSSPIDSNFHWETLWSRDHALSPPRHRRPVVSSALSPPNHWRDREKREVERSHKLRTMHCIWKREREKQDLIEITKKNLWTYFNDQAMGIRSNVRA